MKLVICRRNYLVLIEIEGTTALVKYFLLIGASYFDRVPLQVEFLQATTSLAAALLLPRILGPLVVSCLLVELIGLARFSPSESHPLERTGGEYAPSKTFARTSDTTLSKPQAFLGIQGACYSSI